MTASEDSQFRRIRGWIARHPDLVLVLGMAALSVAVLGDYFFVGSRMVPGLPTEDGRTNWLPWRVFLGRHLRNGVIPLWNPHVLCGTPFLSNFQSAVFYPPNLLYAFLPIHLAANLSISLHLFLSLAFTYALGRRMGLSRESSVLAGVGFTFCAQQFLRIHQGNWGAVCAIPWIPLMFFAAEGMITGKGIRSMLLGGAALAMQLLSGAPQTVLYTLLALGVYGLCRIAGERTQQRPSQLWGIRIVLLAGAVGVGFALAAVQVLPGLAALGELTRSRRLNPAWAESFYLPLGNLVTLAVPRFFGDGLAETYWGKYNFWEMCIYGGAVSVPLALASVWADRRRALALWAVAILCGVMALGRQTPLYFLFGHLLPGAMKLRGICKMFCLASFSLAMLAGFGLDAALRGDKRGRGGRTASWALCGMGTVLLLFCVGVSLWPSAWARFHAASLSAGCRLGERYQMKTMTLSQALARRWYAAALAQWDAWRSAAFIAAAAAVVLFGFRGRLRRGTAAWLMVAIVLLDMVWFGRRYVGAECRFDPYLRDSPFSARDLEPLWRHADRVFLPEWKAMNDPMILGSRAVEGIEPNPPRRFHELFCLTQKNEMIDIAPSFYKIISFWKVPPVMGLRLVAARHDVDVDMAKLSNHRRRSTCWTAEYEAALPRAYVARGFDVEPDPGRALRKTCRIKCKPLTSREQKLRWPRVVLEEEPEDPAPGEHLDRQLSDRVTIDGEAEIRNPNALVVRAELANPGILVLSDNYMPGWRATTNGKPVRIYRANYAFRALYLGTGKHRIEFRYRPASYVAGLWVSAAAWLGLCAYLGLRAWRFLRRRAALPLEG